MNKLAPSATDMIRLDHSHVMTTFHQFKNETSIWKKKAIVKTICLGLEIHAQLEEEIFYPAMREFSDDAGQVDKSIPEHDEMRRLIAELRAEEPGNENYDRLVLELMRDVIHHVADEETILLPDAERLLGKERLSELGAQMTKRRLELALPRTGEILTNSIVSLPMSYLVGGALVLLAGSYALKNATTSRA